LNDRVANLQKLLGGESPAVSKLQLFDAQSGLAAAKHERARTQIQIKQIHLNQLQAEERRRQQRLDKAAQLMQSEQNLEYLTQLHKINSEIRSPFEGTVLEIMVKPGQLITPNTPVVSLQKAEETLEARLYLPPAQGKRVLPGMLVQIEPVSVKKEVFGLMLGEVSAVAPFPARPESMLRSLQNSTLVSEFSQHGAPIEVVVRLMTNRTARSGYQWTSGRGPPLAMTSGTLCEGTITLTNHRPISLVLPLAQENLDW
jgi:HlyD family secretion protein